ncbi:MAG: hypothetical protein ACI9SJ_000007 [Flavobacteriaceae bacterium]|jgi:hypothetical protein|uniref:hypothetical protein n=1 Tax=Candidatus Marifrigoribacter sp. Uisw_064 TaxID=3230970 RepID=UPI003AEEE291
MKPLKIFFTAIAFIFLTSYSYIPNEVYICTGKYSKKYHYTNKCRGLSNCKGSIKEVTLSDAKNFGRTLCGWED